MSLRDLILVSVLGATLPFALRYAFVGVLLWTWIGIMNPHKLAWGFMFNAPVASAVGAVTLVALFTTKDRVKLPLAPPLVFMILFLVWTCITTLTAFYPDASANQLEKVLKIQLMLLVTASVLYKFEHIRLYIWVNVLSLAFYGVKGGIYTIMTAGGGRVWGPPGGFISGNNELALALIMAIPLMYFLRLTTPHAWLKRFLLLAMGLSAISAIGTQSRGAFVAIIAMGGVLWWRAPNKLINLLMIGMLAGAIWTFMPQSWHDRIYSIQTYEDDGSAMGRIFAWQTAINIANDKVVGAGYAMYEKDIFQVYAPPAGDSVFDSSIARAAHSIYFQVLGEHGYIGLSLFMLIWISAWRMAARLRRGTRKDEETMWLYHFGSMAQVSLIGWLAGGAFLSLSYWDFPYNVVVTLIVASRWQKERHTVDIRSPDSSQGAPQVGFINRVQCWIRTA
ncbi:MAG: putative O-glycosylation ligase, exosortase A system-associated [Chromatocurvus sp.]